MAKHKVSREQVVDAVASYVDARPHLLGRQKYLPEWTASIRVEILPDGSALVEAYDHRTGEAI